MATDEPPVADPPPSAPPALDPRNRLGLRILANAVLPVLVYSAVRGRAGSDAEGLAIAAALPAAWTLVTWGWRRRIDPIGLLALLGFALALAASAFLGGNSLAFKLRRPAVTGTLGVALLISAAVRRPLLLPALGLLARFRPGAGALLDRVTADPRLRTRLTIATAAIGAALVAEALLQTVLAITLPTGVWLSLKPIFGVGVILLLLVLRTRRLSGRGRSPRPR